MKRICFALTAILLSSSQAVLAGEPSCASSITASTMPLATPVSASVRKPVLACAIETRLFSRKADDGKNYTPVQACSAAAGDMKLALAND
jgi:hypothetical protein